MPVFSRPACIGGPCWDLVHPWEPSCRKASLDFLLLVAGQSLKVYSIFYGLSAVLQLKGPMYWLKECIPSILRSTTFMSVNGGLLLMFICLYRRLLGGFYYWTVLGGPALVTSFLAILVERKERRTPLAIYISTIVAESFFNILKAKNWVKPIPCGELLLFSAATAVFMRELSANPKKSGLIASLLKLLFNSRFPHFLTKHLPKEGKAGWLCGVAEVMLWSFLVGYAMKVLSGLVGLLSKAPRKWTDTGEIRQRLMGKWHVRLALFCASFTGGYKVVSRLLEAVGVTGATNAMLSGGAAGLSMAFYSSPTLALYAFFKCLHSLGREASNKGFIKVPPHLNVLLYCLATPPLLHLSTMEPMYVRKEYYHFTNRMSGKRIQDFVFTELNVWNPATVTFIADWKKKYNKPVKEIEQDDDDEDDD